MSIIEQAETELKLVNFGEDDSRVMLDILRQFFDQWDSGGAVSFAAPVLQRLIAGKPLAPLTGADGEWVDQSHANGGEPMFQNSRCGTVFKGADGRAYNIDEPGRPTITFPYWPDKAEVGSPVVVIG